jgi:hypothetical protein
VCEMIGQGERSVLLPRLIKNTQHRIRVYEASSVVEPSNSAVTLSVWSFDRALKEGSERRFLRVEAGAGRL